MHGCITHARSDARRRRRLLLLLLLLLLPFAVLQFSPRDARARRTSAVVARPRLADVFSAFCGDAKAVRRGAVSRAAYPLKCTLAASASV